MNDRDALYRTVCENPHEDTPRLVFADWLQENGDELWAEFIRVQCRLSSMARTDEDYFEVRLRERQLLMMGLDGGWLSDRSHTPEQATELPVFERGFPAWVELGESNADEAPEVTRRSLQERFEDSPARMLNLAVRNRSSWFRRVLNGPEADDLTGLELSFSFECSPDEIPIPPRLRWLSIAEPHLEATLSILASCLPPGTLHTLRITFDNSIPTQAFRQLMASAGVSELRVLILERRTLYSGWSSALLEEVGAILCETAPARIVHLGLTTYSDELRQLAGSGTMPEVLSLDSHSYADAEAMSDLVRWGGHPLVELKTRGSHLGVADIQALRVEGDRSPLRSLVFREARLDLPAAKELADPTRFGALRCLMLQADLYDQAPLAALLSSGLPALRSLDLSPYERSRVLSPARTAEALSSIDLPMLSHLNLDCQQLGAAGIKAFARRPCLRTLRSLELWKCGIREAGAKALFESPYLTNLEYLDLRDNPIGGAAEALADPSVLPSLIRCRLDLNDLGPRVRKRLNESGRVTS